ncbi:hypothetical protein ACFQUU_10745 [Herbaspirillum sp. GCM10030257]|uniref:hypothetical protein n=1 Tax=Herbaspirillum sp. GCM10030257 TaxID=3273393 RepID=UPI0036137916
MRKIPIMRKIYTLLLPVTAISVFVPARHAYCTPCRPYCAFRIAMLRNRSHVFLEYIMAGSTLDPDNIPEPDRSLGTGHDTASLGPSDISDSGSDVQPGLHGIEELDIGLDKGTSEDPDSRVLKVEGDSDAAGTGEYASAGRDSVETASDIGIDRIDYVNPEDDPDLTDLDMPPPPDRQADRRQPRKQ